MGDAGSAPLRLPFPVRVFIAGCLLSGLLAFGVHAWLRVATARRLDEEALNLEAKITARMDAYVALLRGAAGFFAADRFVERDQFRRYFDQVEVGRNYPGVQGVGLSVRLKPAEVASFVKRMRAGSWPDFRLWPEGPRADYHAIVFLEPEDKRNRAAVGFDMHTDPVRRAAMDRAADSGTVAVTGKVTLVQEIDAAKQAGFLLYFPYYRGDARPRTVAERRMQLAGFAYAAFRAGDFMAALVEPQAGRGVAVSLYDSPAPFEPALIFATADEDTPPPNAVTRQRLLRILDRHWTLVCSAEPKALLSPLALCLLGIVTSAGLAMLFRGVETARSRAERSEAATREREGELALLVDAVPALVAYVDQNLVFRLCNRRYAEWLNLSPETLVGRRVADVFGPDVFAGVVPYLRRALAGEGGTFERWYKAPGTGARFLGTLYVPHRSDTGTITGVYVLTSDLTSHKRSEEAAQFMADCGRLLIASMDYESTARGVVHLAVPRVADVAVLFRAEGDQLVADAVAHVDATAEKQLSAFLASLRLPISAPHNIGLAARTGLAVVSTELNADDLERAAADEAQRQMLRALRLRSALHVPVVVRGQIWAVFSFGTTMESGRQFTDEHRQLAEEISTRVRLAAENALLYREAQQEIEERRRAQRVAQQSEERFSLLVEGVRDYAIVALDAEGRIESWNEGAERLLGFAEPDVVGMAAARLYPPEDQQAGVAEHQLGIARDRGAATEERWFGRKDGTRFWATSHIAALHEDGTIRGYAWIMRDLTDRKRMEEELEHRVQLRTTELNEAVHELEAFSYSVSHDLRAPLRTIRGFTELALEEAGGRLTDEERGYLDRVRRASARLERLIADLLAYTRVSKTKVELRRVDLQALVSDIQREHPEFQPPRADVHLQAPLAPVTGNEAYLTQCVTNLLGNAVKFVAPGRQPEVHVWTERRDALVRLYFRDNGIGIEPEHLSRAFEMFERLHTNRTYEGTGVGLAIVRRAVQRMKGNVGVSSKVGEGTTFWIELPAAD